MHLAKVEIKKFRSLKDITILLRPGLNVLVGRNNTGKTNLFNAIRHALGPSASRGESLWLTRDDFHIDAKTGVQATSMSVILTFADLTEQERSHFYEIVDFDLNDLAGSTIPIQTVHAVKGETHDTTVFVCPPHRRVDRCPSTVWWSDDLADLEERRIAYVAVTRTQGDLILCVCEKTWDGLRTKRSEFVDLFEPMTIDQFISTAPETE